MQNGALNCSPLGFRFGAANRSTSSITNLETLELLICLSMQLDCISGRTSGGRQLRRIIIFRRLVVTDIMNVAIGSQKVLCH